MHYNNGTESKNLYWILLTVVAVLMAVSIFILQKNLQALTKEVAELRKTKAAECPKTSEPQSEPSTNLVAKLQQSIQEIEKQIESLQAERLKTLEPPNNIGELQESIKASEQQLIKAIEIVKSKQEELERELSRLQAEFSGFDCCLPLMPPPPEHYHNMENDFFGEPPRFEL